MTEEAKIDDGGQAFPRPASTDTFNDENYAPQRGMTLRDWFAGQVLAQAYLQWIPGCTWFDAESARMAQECYSIADAMLKARKQ